MNLPRSVITLVSLTFVLLAKLALAQDTNQGVIHLLNGKDLKPFYTFLKTNGKNNDPQSVFTVTNGILRISGEDFGYISTIKDYSNFKLVAEFKWGEQTWGERKANARDSGVLVYGNGIDRVWPTAVECQMIEGGTGDILVVNGALLTVDGVKKGPRIERFDRPGRNPWKDVLGFRGPNEIENPHGEWNTLEAICDGGKVALSVNGHATITGTNCNLSTGTIMLQSEGAEVFFRRLDIYPLQRSPSN